MTAGTLGKERMTFEVVGEAIKSSSIVSNYTEAVMVLITADIYEMIKDDENVKNNLVFSKYRRISMLHMKKIDSYTVNLVDNMNIDENTMNNIKNMVDNGNIQDAISQISPEMLQNFSQMLSNQNNSQDNQNNSQNFSQNNMNSKNNVNSNENNINPANNFDFSNIDMNTIMKMSSAFGKINNSKNDPSANLLNSLKPYLRDSKKDKLDNYMNLLNIAKIAEIVKDNNKENN